MEDNRSATSPLGLDGPVAPLQPHPMHLVDGLLLSSIGPYASRVVFGFVPPGGRGMLPAATVAVSTEALYRIAKQLVHDIEKAAPQFRSEYERFSGSLASGASSTESSEAAKPKPPRPTSR